MSKINYTEDNIVDILKKQQGYSLTIIPCSTVERWNSSFCLEISKLSVEPERYYRKLLNKEHYLGQSLAVSMDVHKYAALLFSVVGTASTDNPIPFKYEHFVSALRNVVGHASNLGLKTVHSPRLCTPFDGGCWQVCEILIQEIIVSNGIDFIVHLTDGFYEDKTKKQDSRPSS